MWRRSRGGGRKSANLTPPANDIGQSMGVQITDFLPKKKMGDSAGFDDRINVQTGTTLRANSRKNLVKAVSST